MSLELHNAIRSCNFEEIKAALENHSNEINIPDPMLGWTPLYKAVLYRDYEITKLLLENGADPDQCNQIGENALHMAVDNNLEEIVDLLIQYKAKLDFCGNDGQTPLHLAVLKKNEKIVQNLIKGGASANCLNVVGKTPLHFAIESELTEIVKILLEAGSDPNIHDKCGISPFQMTNSEALKEIIEPFCEKNDPKALKEKSLNLSMGNNEIIEEPKLKQKFSENIAKIDENVEILARKKTEMRELSSEIEKSLQQFKNFEPSQFSDHSLVSKKKSMNFEEFKASQESPKSPSLIKDEASIHELKADSQSHIESQNQSQVESKPEPNIPMTLKTSENLIPSNAKPISQWLSEIRLDCLLQNFLDLGLEDNNLLIGLLKSNTQNWDKMLITHLGIDKPGYRKRVITKLKEDMGLCKRSGLFKLKNSNAKLRFLDLNEWLKSLDLEEWASHFMAAGYDDYESLIFQMTTDNAINERILEEDVMIDDQFARMKICNQLMEDALKASEIDAPDNFEGEISFEINEQKPGTWKETCLIF